MFMFKLIWSYEPPDVSRHHLELGRRSPLWQVICWNYKRPQGVQASPAHRAHDHKSSIDSQVLELSAQPLNPERFDLVLLDKYRQCQGMQTTVQLEVISQKGSRDLGLIYSVESMTTKSCSLSMCFWDLVCPLCNIGKLTFKLGASGSLPGRKKSKID